MAEQHLRRVTSATSAPAGIQWFVGIQFASREWYRDRTRMDSLLDALASTSWFREFDVFAPGIVPGTPFDRIDDVRDSVANGEELIAMFAHGDARMTEESEQAEAALALSILPRSLELRVWFSARPVAQYKGAVLGDLAALLVALRAEWTDCFISSAQAFPRPFDVVKYPRTRPLRITNRATNAVVDILDRDMPSEGAPWAHDTEAMLKAPVPSGVQREEHGRLVVIRWVDDPSDPRALAQACSRHEQWLVPLVTTRLAEGWNDAGDIRVFDVPYLIEAGSDDVGTWGKPESSCPTALVAGNREEALKLLDRARAAGFSRVVYRDPAGALWDPDPPGEWVM